MILSTAIIILALVAIDRASKVLVPALLEGGKTVTLIEGVIELRLLEGGNTGAAFGILKGGTGFLIIVTVVLVLALLYILCFKKVYSRLMRAAVLLITAGGIGNLYDRIAHGSVTDFFNLLFVDFPVFNVADCYVTVGSVILVAALLFSKPDEPIFVTDAPNKRPESGGKDAKDDARDEPDGEGGDDGKPR